MSKAIPGYFTEDQKLVKLSKRKAWTMEQCITIHQILASKGYLANCVNRIGADMKWHDAIQVEREDVPILIEMCFRQRFHVEAQAEGKGKAALIFVYDQHAEDIINGLRRFWKNPKNGGKL